MEASSKRAVGPEVRLLFTAPSLLHMEDREEVLGGSNVAMHEDKGSYQQWRVSDAGEGTVFITSHLDKHLEDREKLLGFSAVATNEDRGSYQKWWLSNAGDGKVFIVSHLGKYLDAVDFTKEVRTIQESGPDQAWRIVTTDGDACFVDAKLLHRGQLVFVSTLQ